MSTTIRTAKKRVKPPTFIIMVGSSPLRAPAVLASVPAALAIVVAGPGASASPLSDPNAGRAVFTGATSGHPTSLELNPAALSLSSPGWHVYLSGSLAIDQIGIDRRAILTPDANAAPTDGPSVSGTRGSWGTTAAVFAGYADGIISSLGIMVATDPDDVFQANEDALRYHTLGGAYRELKFLLGGSLRATSDLHIGATVGLVLSSRLGFEYARDTALDAGSACPAAECGFENPRAAEIYRLDVRAGVRDLDTWSEFFDDDRLVLAAGILYQVVPDWWIGLAYRSPQGLGRAQLLTGDVSITRSPASCPDGTSCTVQGEATVAMDLPHSVHGSLRGRLLPGLDLTVGLRLENLSRVQQYDVRTFGVGLTGIPEWQPRPRGLDNVYSVVAGVEQVDSGQRFRAGGRLGVETAAVSAERISPTQVDGLAITADGGAQLRVLPSLVIQVTYGASYYPEVTADPGAFDPRFATACAASGYDYSTTACAAVRDGYAIPTAAGSYRRFSHAARLALRYDFL
jgi:hypothetical protein